MMYLSRIYKFLSRNRNIGVIFLMPFIVFNDLNTINGIKKLRKYFQNVQCIFCGRFLSYHTVKFPIDGPLVVARPWEICGRGEPTVQECSEHASHPSARHHSARHRRTMETDCGVPSHWQLYHRRTTLDGICLRQLILIKFYYYDLSNDNNLFSYYN